MTTDSGLRRRALRLSYFTVGYNVVEGILAVFAGFLAGSIALVGFGLDSAVESLSGVIMIWRFRGDPRQRKEEEDSIEASATRFIGFTFFILAAYVAYESVNKLDVQTIPDPSLLGIGIAIASLVVMPILFFVKYRTGQALGSPSLMADSKETLACAFLSAALLIGLAANYLYGLGWMDPAVGLIIVVFLMREGYLTLKEGGAAGP